ncbi:MULTISPECIES: hypothetical protein [Limnospira]|uniref:Cyanovirin-N domain-containing protein n=2 Tax=Sirenicapillariaceae TaxID=2934961 RepID=A0ABU9EUW7_LIMFS|nr:MULTISPECIES: hypothetical protein [unclassified Limnospira]MDY7051586.1 hypothetical protein [Limnospira fusiformis LS22]RAQ45716.1 hypothetical protein B9S53_07370 [Arthrospira sp. O9.13F]MDT9236105.1 hypothetical protein [Limnospira sp. PMC 917.15]MDT9277114.1 hypothetical protein [Limnospira sp. PMC 737.11]RAQ45749.1 hypothetical protein B9S53_07170 [Arthrospira sp. O9.13F]
MFKTIILLKLSLVGTIWLLQQTTHAGSIGPIARLITSNSLYECQTDGAFEIILGNSNMSHTSGSFSMICLNTDDTAHWILESSIACEERACDSTFLSGFFGFHYNVGSTVNRTQVPIAVLGKNCQFQPNRSEQGNGWLCEQLITQDAMTITTRGENERMYIRDFLNRYSLEHFQLISSGIIPADAEQANLLRTSRKKCYGSSQFCR